MLGELTEDSGFIPSDKNILRTERKASRVDIKNFSLYRLFYTLIKEDFDGLKVFFSEEVCELLFSFAMFCWPLKEPFIMIIMIVVRRNLKGRSFAPT